MCFKSDVLSTFREVTAQCARCRGDLGPMDLVCRALTNVYHPRCFRCSVCDVTIRSDDVFHLRLDNSLICRLDYEKLKAKSEYSVL